MSDIKKINRQFLIALLSFLGIVILLIVGDLLAYLYIENANITYPIYLSTLLILLFLTSHYQNTLDQITNMSYLIKIRANEAKPISIKNLKSIDAAGIILRENGYECFISDNTYSLYYKIEYDHIKKIFRNYILTIFIVLKNKNAEFYLERVDAEVNKLRDQQFKAKKRVTHLIITQIKEIDSLDDKTKEAIKEIVFIRTKRFLISTINIGLHRSSQQAVMLYSDTYSPSLYYKYQIEEIKKII